jgi:creatinine amidohydrolase
MYSYEMTADDIVKQDPELAIIPVGSLEQHGPHLPIMTDWKIAGALGQGVAEKTGGFLIPALPISTCREHMGKKGSVWMEPPTFYQMMTDIIMSLKTQGFKKVCILQCHGGIFVMTNIVRDLNAKYNPDLLVANIDTITLFPILLQEGLVESSELHAGELETSKMLALAHDSVHMDRAVDFVPDIPRPYLSYGSIFRATPCGVWGEPTRATKEKGEALLRRSVELAVEEMEKIFAYMEKKERFGYSYF